MDLKLDTTGDIDVTDGVLTLLEGSESVRQHWEIRNKFFLGEWFLDQRLGVAYFETILRKNPNLRLVRAIFRRVLLQTPGIASVSRFDLVLDIGARRVTIEAEGLLEPRVAAGDPSFVFEYEAFIVDDQVEELQAG